MTCDSSSGVTWNRAVARPTCAASAATSTSGRRGIRNARDRPSWVICSLKARGEAEQLIRLFGTKPDLGANEQPGIEDQFAPGSSGEESSADGVRLHQSRPRGVHHLGTARLVTWDNAVGQRIAASLLNRGYEV
jgi:hypothetical protein